MWNANERIGWDSNRADVKRLAASDDRLTEENHDSPADGRFFFSPSFSDEPIVFPNFPIVFPWVTMPMIFHILFTAHCYLSVASVTAPSR